VLAATIQKKEIEKPTDELTENDSCWTMGKHTVPFVFFHSYEEKEMTTEPQDALLLVQMICSANQRGRVFFVVSFYSFFLSRFFGGA